MSRTAILRRIQTAASLIVLGLVASLTSAWGQTSSNPKILIFPFGQWQLCESSFGANSPACAGFVPGGEQFLLMMKASQPETNRFLYTIVATMPDGSTRAVSGQLKRDENGAGYSVTTLYFGGVPLSFNATVEEATVNTTQTATGAFVR